MYYWLFFIAFELVRNRWMRVNGIKPNYFQSFLIRGSASIIHASFYFVFDLILNIWTGDEWNYQGKSSGYLDKLPMWAYLGLKGLCFIYLVHFIWMH